MEHEFRKITFLKIYTGEDIMLGDEPLYKAIIAKARELGLAGGTVMKAIEGYASKLRGVNRVISSFVSGNANLPVVIEIVDSKENITKILPFLEEHANHALVLVEESNYLLTDYIRQRIAERHGKEEN